jgi:DnaJ-class molecular chaperone
MSSVPGMFTHVVRGFVLIRSNREVSIIVFRDGIEANKCVVGEQETAISADVTNIGDLVVRVNVEQRHAFAVQGDPLVICGGIRSRIFCKVSGVLVDSFAVATADGHADAFRGYLSIDEQIFCCCNRNE